MSAKTPVKKAPAKKKAAKGYQLPEPIKKGEVLKDVLKKQWQIGPSIGVGGFGEIYSATDIADTPKKKSSFPYVVKIEPHGNGPLFVEMHFYMKVGKPTDIEAWMNEKKLKKLGMPQYLGSGSHEYNGQKYRFVVMDRYGKDLWSLFLENNRKFPIPTVLKIGLQVIDVLEYIHSKTYIHADIKGGNLLLGLQKGSEHQTFLVDFGLASHYSQKEFKPDPKKAHNGTIEYTSRDAHMGVPTRRGDMEILGYNMLQWLASKLPWEAKLNDPVQVQQEKIKYMENIPALMKKCFDNTTPPAALVKYFEYVATLKYDDEPDYAKCRKILEKGLKDCKCSPEGKLEFSNTVTETKSGKSSPQKGKKRRVVKKSSETNKKKTVDLPAVNGNEAEPRKVASSSTDLNTDSTDTTDDKSDGKTKKVVNGNIDKSKFVMQAGVYKRLPPDQRPYSRTKKQKNDE